jgi:hypothetical protein
VNYVLNKTKQDYGTCVVLINEEKLAKQNPIYLRDKANNVQWEIGSSRVNHIELNQNLDLVLERSRRESKYVIKLKCPSFTETPVFRFDSAGPAHRNSRSTLVVEEQQVTTALFDCFAPDGKSFAYKNLPLQDEGTAAAISDDVDFGMYLFCRETNVWLVDGN